MIRLFKNKAVLLVLIFILVYLLYSNFFRDPPNHIHNVHTSEVKIFEIVKKNVKLNFEYPAKVTGCREVEVKSQVNGILLKKLYQEGSPVNKDDILFQIDSKPYLAELKKAKAQLSTSQAHLVKEEKSFKRSKVLFENKAISAQERDSDMVKLKEAEDAVSRAEAALNLADINLSYTSITSPINGFVSKAAVSEGNLINSGEVITKIVQNNLMYINFSYPESDFYKIQKLINENKVILPSLDKLTFTVSKDGEILSNIGTVNFTDYNLDPNTSSFSSRIEILNENNKLRSGQFIRVSINDFIYKDAIVIPAKAVIQTTNGPIVYVVNSNDEINIKPIVIEYITGENYIIESGVNFGDKIIVEDIMKLQPNQKVKVTNISNTNSK